MKLSENVTKVSPRKCYGALRDHCEALRKHYGASCSITEALQNITEALHIIMGCYRMLQCCGTLWNVTEVLPKNHGVLQNITEHCGTLRNDMEALHMGSIMGCYEALCNVMEHFWTLRKHYESLRNVTGALRSFYGMLRNRYGKYWFCPSLIKF